MMSSTFSRPFLEENDVSGQVVKSIYAENQVNDSQTQRTGQAMALFAAVRTELKMASNPTEDTQPKSFSTSLNSYDLNTCYNKFLQYYHLPLLPSQPTIKMFFQHLQQTNYTHLLNTSTITLKTDKTEAHIYLLHELTILPDHYISSTNDCLDIPLKSQSNSQTANPIPTNIKPKTQTKLKTPVHFEAVNTNNILFPGHTITSQASNSISRNLHSTPSAK